MRENHNKQSCEYIIIFQGRLYIVSSTPDEFLHMLKDKYKINIYLQGKYPHVPGGRDIYQVKEFLEQLYENVNAFQQQTSYRFHISTLYISNFITSNITYISTSLYTRKKKT